MPYDALITRDGPVNAPLDYVVPNNAIVMPGVIAATFDDPTNAGPYIPVVEVLTPSGVVLGPFPLSTTIAAGGSARVSWFQGVGGAGAGSSAAGSLMAARVNIVGNQNIVQGDPGTVVTWGEAAFDTGLPTPFWSAAAPTLLTAPVDGYYLSLPNPIWDLFTHPITSDAETAFYLYRSTQVPDGFHALTKESETPMGPIHYSFVGQHHAPVFLNAGESVKINSYFDDGAGGTTQASINLLDLRTIGYSSLVTSWSIVLLGT